MIDILATSSAFIEGCQAGLQLVVDFFTACVLMLWIILVTIWACIKALPALLSLVILFIIVKAIS